jgi:hypothetical protein
MDPHPSLGARHNTGLPDAEGLKPAATSLKPHGCYADVACEGRGLIFFLTSI